MKLKNILFVVNDIEKSKRFYQELFGLRVITDFGENVSLTIAVKNETVSGLFEKIRESTSGRAVTLNIGNRFDYR